MPACWCLLGQEWGWWGKAVIGKWSSGGGKTMGMRVMVGHTTQGGGGRGRGEAVQIKGCRYVHSSHLYPLVHNKAFMAGGAAAQRGQLQQQGISDH